MSRQTLIVNSNTFEIPLRHVRAIVWLLVVGLFRDGMICLHAPCVVISLSVQTRA